MRNIKLTIEYDGTEYNGWQKQKSGKTIQETIERAIKRLTNEDVQLIGSSRTDAGVHARGMTANFITSGTIPSERFREAINTKLPDDISIIKSEEVSMEFHSRYNSTGKTYSYSIINREEKVAIGRRYNLVVRDALDVNLMKNACEQFIGKHDFTSFKSSGSSVKTSIRTIKELYITKSDDNIKIVITADGFLYNMVRIIVGTLIEVGKKKIQPTDIIEIINNKDRTLSGPCVGPNGLVLEIVYY